MSFLGVRGSTPAPGAEFLRYGGHTSSVALSHDGEAPSLVLDAGTGIRTIGSLLGGEPLRATILLSHLHWDHVHGLPFCGPAFAPGHDVRLLVPAPNGDPVGTLALGMSPPHFPVGPREIADWRYEQLCAGEMKAGGFNLLVREVPHKGGQTFGVRVEDGRGAIAYLTDHAPQVLGPGADGLGELHDAALELCAGADVVIHDAQFTAAEFPAVAYLGHSAVEYAVALAEAAGAASLALFHHAPERTDDEIDEIVASVGSSTCKVFAARQGMSLTL